MDFEVRERRAVHRFPPPAAANVHVTMRPGCRVVLVDVSEEGALIEAPRPLRPGGTIHLLVTAGDARQAITARVLRCAVAALEPTGGVIYRGGLLFEARIRWPWAVTAQDRIRLLAHERPNQHRQADPIPVLGDPQPDAVVKSAK